MRSAPSTPAGARQSPSRGVELDECFPGVADDRQRPVLVGVEAGRVDADEAHVGFCEHRPRTGGEVAEASADGDDDVGLGGEAVGTLGADDADRPGVVRVVVGQRRLAGDRLDDGDAVTAANDASVSSASE